MPLVSPLAAAPRPAQPDQFRINPDQKLPSAESFRDSPGGRLINKYGHELFAMMGARTIVWNRSEPDVARLWVEAPHLVKLADTVLNDTVDGARIVVERYPDSADTPVPVPGDWTDNGSNYVRAVDALPGVYRHIRESNRAAFFTVDEPTADKLRALVSPKAGNVTMQFVGVDPSPSE